MKFKGTWIFAVLVLAVAGYAIYDYQKNETSEQNKASENQAYKGQSSENVKTFSMKNAGGEFQLTNANGHWSMTSPLKDKIDHQTLESFISDVFSENLKNLELETPPPAGDARWVQFGLDKPAAHIEIVFNDGKTSTLDFGSVRAYDESYYVRKDNGLDVMLGAASWNGLITKNANELRDKTLYPNKGEVSSFTVKQKGQASYSFKLAEGKWVLDKQPGFKVDDSAIIDFINRVRHVNADRILGEEKTPAELRKNVLMPDQADTVIAMTHTGDDAQDWSMTVASTKTDRAAIVSSSTLPVFEIATSKLVGLRPDVSYFRNKLYPFQFDPATAHQVRVLKKGDPLEMRYTKINGTWEIDVENPHLKLDPSKVDGLIEGLRNLTAAKYFGHGKWNSKEIQENRFQVLDITQQQLFVLEWGGSYRENDQDFYLVKTNLADEIMSVAKASIDEIANRSLLIDEPKSAAPGALVPPAAEPKK